MRPAPIPIPDPSPEVDWDYRLDSRYEAGRRRVFLTGTQALVKDGYVESRIKATAITCTARSQTRSSPLFSPRRQQVCIQST